MKNLKWYVKMIPNVERTPEEYNEAVYMATPLYFNTLKECFDYIGFRLPKQRCGYAGCSSMYEYIVMKTA